MLWSLFKGETILPPYYLYLGIDFGKQAIDLYGVIVV